MNLKKAELPFAYLGKTLWGVLRYLSNFLRRHRTINALFVTVLTFVLFWIISENRLDPDFGWHLKSGIYFRKFGIPMHDIYTYTAQSYKWIDHEWGNDVIMSWLYSIGGYSLVSFLYASLWTLATLVAGAFKVRIIVLFTAIIALSPYAGNRPLAWTMLLAAVLFRIIQSPNKRYRWIIPLLFIPWANLHAGFIAGLGLIAYFSLKERSKTLLTILGISTLATLINAYGARLYFEIAHTIFDPAIHSQIQEWKSFSIPGPSILFMVLWLTGFWMFRPSYQTGVTSTVKENVKAFFSYILHIFKLLARELRLSTLPENEKKKLYYWFDIAPILLATAFSASRNFPLFVIFSMKQLDTSMTKVIDLVPKKLDRPRKVVLGSIIGLLSFWLLYSAFLTYLPWTTNRENNYPITAVTYLKEHKCSGNLFNSYDYGGYLIWKLPSQPVYIDGRMPTWVKYMNKYEAVINNPAKNYKTEFQRYNIKCVLVGLSDGKKLSEVLIKAHWNTVLIANGAELLLSPENK